MLHPWPFGSRARPWTVKGLAIVTGASLSFLQYERPLLSRVKPVGRARVFSDVLDPTFATTASFSTSAFI
jgi:hypothetical protein